MAAKRQKFRKIVENCAILEHFGTKSYFLIIARFFGQNLPETGGGAIAPTNTPMLLVSFEDNSLLFSDGYNLQTSLC